MTSSLPSGAHVYTYARVDSPEPDALPKRRWAWFRVVGQTTPGRARTLCQFENETPLEIPTQRLYIKSSSGSWMRVTTALTRNNRAGHWWWHGNHVESFRVATELEVALYHDGFIPHEHWRLFDCTGEILQEPADPAIWLTRPEPPTEDELASRRDVDRKAKRSKKLEHARKMLADWTRKELAAAHRKQKWMRAVTRLSK